MLRPLGGHLAFFVFEFDDKGQLMMNPFQRHFDRISSRFMLTVKIIFFFILSNAAQIFAQNVTEKPTVLQLKGYLGKEELAQVKTTLDLLTGKPKPTLIIEINSSSGDLPQLLDLAKSIYALKILKQLKVIVYMDDSVIGPAAILPFLADDLYASLFISWGDIPLGSESYPANVLRNRVQSLIDPQNPHAGLLTVLADAMSDPSQQVVVEGQVWKIAHGSLQSNQKPVSIAGQTLVLNQNQLKELNLVNAILPYDQFQKAMHLYDSIQQLESFPEHPLELAESSLMEKLKRNIHFDPSGANQIGYLYVGDHESSINQSTWLYIKQGLEHYKKTHPDFIILELDTPGGEVFAAQKISDALKEMDTQYNIPVVAFINNWAISAGAMLAYSCRFIVTVKDGSMGAAEPVFAGEGGKMEAASEKVNSALRADFANRAGFFDRNPLLAEAMVDKDILLVLRHGKIVKLDSDNQIRTTGPEPDLVISAKGKLLTLNAEKMVEYGVADLLLLPKKLSAVTSEEKAAGQWPADKMLLFQAPYFSTIPQATVHAYQMDWKTRFFVFLATPMVSSLLFMGLLIGAYIEFNHPGLSLPGIVAGLCLFLIILSSFALEIANWLELILLLAGLVLLLLELFVLPTMGILIMLGSILFLAGLIGMLVPGINAINFEYDTKTLNAAGQFALQRLAWLSGAFILSGVIIAFLARYVMPGFTGFHRLVLEGHEQDASKGFIAGESAQTLPKPGSEGVVLATLRPAGKVVIEDQVYDAISVGGMIEAEESITVLKLDGSVIVVTRKEGNIKK